MRFRKICYFLVGMAILVILLHVFTTPSINCVPNEERTQLELVVRNAEVRDISLKYDDGFLALETPTDRILDIFQPDGLEYVTVNYTDLWGKPSFLVFEIHLSDHDGLLTVLDIGKWVGQARVQFDVY